MPNLNSQRMSQIKQKYSEVYEALRDHEAAINHLGMQTNASPVGLTPAPGSHAAISVKGGAGLYDVAITDNADAYRGKEHFLEYSQDPSFSSPHVIHLGASKNWRGSLGVGPYHFRSRSQYATSAPSDYIYHPPVDALAGSEPQMQAGQGGGYGTEPFTGNKPPIR